MRALWEVFEWLWFVIGPLLVIAVFLIGWVFYDVFGAAPNAKRKAEAEWRNTCIARGGTLIPTERRHTKLGDRYTGWICGKVERVLP